MRRAVAVAMAVAMAGALAACGPSTGPDPSQRVYTKDFEIRVRADVVPPRALEPTLYTVVVRDKKTREPVVNGEGRIFATNSDGKTIYDGFTYGPEVGTYHAKLMFLTAGEWAMSVQFRRDSTLALQKPEYDWRQEIRAGTEPGESTRP
jgi:hypothetical protein